MDKRKINLRAKTLFCFPLFVDVDGKLRIHSLIQKESEKAHPGILNHLTGSKRTLSTLINLIILTIKYNLN
jgi:hypothetical protein